MGGARDPCGETVTFDEGALFEFPRDAQGEVIFCNVEGVAWGGKDLLVTVSDRMKHGEQDSRCAQHDQSIQVFRIPEQNELCGTSGDDQVSKSTKIAATGEIANHRRMGCVSLGAGVNYPQLKSSERGKR